jgi:hypothetical protein
LEQLWIGNYPLNLEQVDVYGSAALLFGLYLDRGQNITGKAFIFTAILALLLGGRLIFFYRSKAMK